MSSSVKNLSVKSADAIGLLKEKDRVIEILRDEVQALQLELVQREEQLRVAKETAHRLEGDNKVLLDRWILLKEEEISKMNEANDFVTTALKSKETVVNKVFSLFRQSSTGPHESSPTPKNFQSSLLPTKILRQFVTFWTDSEITS